MTHFLVAHQVGATLVIYYIFSAAVSAMPMPDSTSGKFYQWIFGMLHTLSGDITKAFASRLPIPASLQTAQTATAQAAQSVQAAQAAISDAKAQAGESKQ
jgi:hypothetical protein